MPETLPILIGYSSPVEWLSAVDSSRPVYASLVDERIPSKSQFVEFWNSLIILGQHDAQGTVHYCRIRIISYAMFSDRQPADPDYDQRQQAARQAWDLMKVWLTMQGLRFLEAVIAAPREYQLLEGDAPFLVFDAKTKTYHLKGGSHVHA